MTITFSKYQGTGNDFILIDDRSELFNDADHRLIQHLCDRKFGIGSDGLILIRKNPQADFRMIFFNPDGSKSFCGNGSRCAVQFCFDQSIITSPICTFEAIDGMHTGQRIDGKISISVNDVSEHKNYGADLFLHTGSPHYIHYVDSVSEVNVVADGSKIRYSDPFKPGGTNVNFVEKSGTEIRVRTYERGVENETLSCGSGVTACALSAALVHHFQSPVTVKSMGGYLSVSFTRNGDSFTNIVLTGPAELVYKGTINV